MSRRDWFSEEGLLIVAELAQSYQGDRGEAETLIRAAAAGRADVVKFQVFTADELAVPVYEHFDLYRRLELGCEAWASLFGLAKTLGLGTAADVFGTASVAMLDELDVDILKVHAADMCNTTLLSAVGRTGRPVLLSCGGSTSGEIGRAIQALRFAAAGPICLLHGFQGSPTAPEDSAFGRLRALRRTFGLPTGYADHIGGDHPLAIHWPLLAVGAGVQVIEKHLTRVRAEQREDYISALEPDEFPTMADTLRLARRAVGRWTFDVGPAEADYRASSRKRVVAARPLSSGTALQLDDVALKRTPEPSDFFDPQQVAGRVLVQSVHADHAITETMLAPSAGRPRLVATLACRAASGRLYAKPLQMIGDRTILEYLVARIQSVARVDKIVLAISEGRENEPFIDYSWKLGLDYVIGDEHDVQERLILAGEKAGADLLLRATTESPFLYTDNIEAMVEQHVAEGADLTVTEGLPDGAYCEIISLAALKDAHACGERRHRSELCTLYLFEHPERYKLIRLKAPARLRRQDVRLTVDYPEDLIVCREIANALGKDGPLITLEAIVDYLDAHPELNAVNGWIEAGQGRIWS